VLALITDYPVSRVGELLPWEIARGIGVVDAPPFVNSNRGLKSSGKS